MGIQHCYKLGLLTFLCCGGLIKENGHRIPNHGKTLRRLQYKDNALHLINIKQTPPSSIQFNTHTQQQHTFLNLQSNERKENLPFIEGWFLSFLGIVPALFCSIQYLYTFCKQDRSGLSSFQICHITSQVLSFPYLGPL